jgi:hypothetical protein
MPPITDNQTLKKLYNAFDGFPFFANKLTLQELRMCLGIDEQTEK